MQDFLVTLIDSLMSGMMCSILGLFVCTTDYLVCVVFSIRSVLGIPYKRKVTIANIMIVLLWSLGSGAVGFIVTFVGLVNIKGNQSIGALLVAITWPLLFRGIVHIYKKKAEKDYGGHDINLNDHIEKIIDTDNSKVDEKDKLNLELKESDKLESSSQDDNEIDCNSDIDNEIGIKS